MKSLVKLSNIVAAISIVLLIYWVFVFILVEVFGLKVFRENLSQTFGLSVLGILALMAGSLMINVMFNMTRIADKQESQNKPPESEKINLKRIAIGLLLVFPVLTVLMFGGDYLTSRKKEAVLINAAKSVIDRNPQSIAKMARYSFTEEWLLQTDEIVAKMQKTDENFPNVKILVLDPEGGRGDILGFESVRSLGKDSPPRSKVEFLFATSVEERAYLDSVFKEGNSRHRFSASDGNYELFYPYFSGDQRIVIYFSDYQRFGKLGS